MFRLTMPFLSFTSRFWLVPAVLLVAACSGVGVVNAQPANPKPEGFAAHFHRDDSTVLVVEDPLPHLQTFLNSPGLRKVLGDGPLGKLLARDGGAGPDPAEAWQWVHANRRWVPKQLAIGLSDAGISDLDHVLRLLTAFELLQGAQSGDEDDAKLRDEIKLLRKAIADALPLTQLPRMRIYIRFRDAEDAGALLDLARLQLDEIPKDQLPAGVSFDNRAAALTARFNFAELLRTEDVDVEELLTDMGIVHIDDGADAVKKAVDAVRSFKAEITLEQVGSGLLLTVGPTTSGGPAGLAADAALLPEAVGKPDARTLVWGRWNAARLKSAAAAWIGFQERWRTSRSYGLVMDDPDMTESLTDSLYNLSLRVRKFADNGSFRFWIDDKSAAVRLAMQEEPRSGAVDLAGSPLSKLLPIDADGLAVETDTSLGETVSDWLLQVEDRLATRSLRADLAGNDDDPAGQMERGYYTHFAPLRDLIHRASPALFEPGYAMLFGTKGKVQRFEASFEMRGLGRRLSGRDLPTPELAMIGKVKGDDAAMRSHVEKTYSALLRGVRSASRAEALADRPLPLVDAKAAQVDLGLGVTTWAFDIKSITQTSGEAKLRLEITGDLQPHFFFVDGFVVFSTSPRLSKSILAARSDAGKRLMLPGEGDGPLVAIGRQTGDSFAKTIDHLKAWYLTLSDEPGADAARREEATEAFDAVAAIARTMKRVEWTTIQPTGERRHVTEGVLLFGEEPATR